MFVEFQRRPNLLDLAHRQHHDSIRQRHRFDLIVRHIDHRRLQVFVQLRELIAHAYAECGIQIRQWLIKQEHFRFANDGATDGDPLTLAAGQVLRFALQQVLDVQNLRRIVDGGIDLRLRHVGKFQAKGHVVEQIHVRIEGVGLKHHRDAAFGGGNIVDDLAANGQGATGNFFESGDGAQQRGLAATGRADEHHEFAVPHLKIDVAQHMNVGVGLLDVDQSHVCHGSLTPHCADALVAMTSTDMILSRNNVGSDAR